LKEVEAIVKVNPTNNNALTNVHESGEDDVDLLFLESIESPAYSFLYLYDLWWHSPMKE
jgi:hypothetical protein